MKILITAGCPESERYPDILLSPLLLGFRKEISISLGQLSALTPNEHQIDVVDEYYFGDIDFSKQYDLVAISSITPHAIRNYEIADEFRKRGATVALGGYHPSALPEEAKKHADSVVIGEAELTWPQLLKDFENGKIKSLYHQLEPIDPNIIPPLKRNFEKGFYCTGVQATRGCQNRCRFCSVHNVEGSHIRKRPIDNVIKEIKEIKSNSFFFADASLTGDAEYSKELFNGIKDLHKHFECFGNINDLEDDELVSSSKLAGCISWWIGFESISQESLDNVGKKTNIVKNYSKIIKKIRNQGIAVKGLFVFGFDYDMPDIFNKTLNAIFEWKIDDAAFLILTPCPGTPLFKQLENEGRLLTRDWSKYNFGNVVFEPKNMSTDELWNRTRSIAKEFFSFSNITKRIMNNPNRNLYTFSNNIISNFLVGRYINKRDYGF